MRELADRVYRRRVTDDEQLARHGVPPLAASDWTRFEWRQYLQSRLELAFIGDRPDSDVIESMLAGGLAYLAALDAAEAVRVETGDELGRAA